MPEKRYKGATMKTIYPSAMIADGYRCTSCGAIKSTVADGVDPSWRWCDNWEHKCPGNIPQAGHFPAEPIGDAVRHFLWRVDDGATWWVIAADEQDALALTIHYAELAGEEVVELWQEEGWPAPERLTAEEASRCWVYDGKEDIKLPMIVDFSIDQRRRLVACSEW